jgi:OOP family OmpA-OmpF porin
LGNATILAKLDNGIVTLTGILSSQEKIDSLIASAKKRYGEDNVTSTMTLSEHVNPLPDLSMFFDGMQLETGAIEVEGSQVSLIGKVNTLDEKESVASDLTNIIGDNAIVINQLEVTATKAPIIEEVAQTVTTAIAKEIEKDNEACQNDLLNAMSTRQIYFESSSVIIKSKSYALLNDIVEILGQCPEASIEVAGHTDSSGQEHKNISLSKRRAESVVEYINKKGISRSALKATGYGSSIPVASNETAEGRSLNRRIEFTIKSGAK